MNQIQRFFWISAVLFFTASPLYADAVRGIADTPEERLKVNTQKAAENPSLRGRWDRLSRMPASEGALLVDNLAQRILENFRKDEELANIPALIKVRSHNGTVTLEGTVPTPAEKALIESKVSRMEGVKKLESHLKVE